MSPSWFHRHLCLAPSLLPVASPRLLSQEAWVSPERVCPWGKPLGSVPCSLADIPAEGRGVRCPPHAHVLAQAGGSASAEESRKREGEARQNLGRSQAPRSASEELQPPTGSYTARSLSAAEPPPPSLGQARQRGPGHGPCYRAPRGRLPRALLPSPGSSHRGSSGARRRGRPGLLLASAPPRRQLLGPAGSALHGGQRLPCGSAPHSVRAQHHGCRGQSLAPAGSALSVSGGQPWPAARFLPSHKQSRGAGASRVPWGWVFALLGDFGFPKSGVGASWGGGLSQPPLWSAVRRGLAMQWRVPAGSRRGWEAPRVRSSSWASRT